MVKISPLARRVAQRDHNSDVSLSHFTQQIGYIRFALHRASDATTSKGQTFRTRGLFCLNFGRRCDHLMVLGTTSMTAPRRRSGIASQMSHSFGPLVCEVAANGLDQLVAKKGLLMVHGWREVAMLEVCKLENQYASIAERNSTSNLLAWRKKPSRSLESIYRFTEALPPFNCKFMALSTMPYTITLGSVESQVIL